MAAAECLGFRDEAVSFAQPSGGLFGSVLDVLQHLRQLRCVVFARIRHQQMVTGSHVAGPG
jgi:hypothetical protein